WHAAFPPLSSGTPPWVVGESMATVEAWRRGELVTPPAWLRRRRELERFACESIEKRLREPPRRWKEDAELDELVGRTLRVFHAGMEVWRCEERSPPPPRPLRFCLCDVHRLHVLFLGDHVDGLIDFGAVGLDAAATDLARYLGTAAPTDPVVWRSVFDGYAEAGCWEASDALLAARLDRMGAHVAPLYWLEWLVLSHRPIADTAAGRRRWRETLDRWVRMA
ncbi:MAG: phosphotransferase, partial [Planctomycetia bacterium]